MSSTGILVSLGLLLFVLARIVNERDRISANTRVPYRLTKETARHYSLIIACAIWLPGWAFFVIGMMLNEARWAKGSFYLYCAMMLLGPLWIIVGYVLTGGRAEKEGED